MKQVNFDRADLEELFDKPQAVRELIAAGANVITCKYSAEGTWKGIRFELNQTNSNKRLSIILSCDLNVLPRIRNALNDLRFEAALVGLKDTLNTMGYEIDHIDPNGIRLGIPVSDLSLAFAKIGKDLPVMRTKLKDGYEAMAARVMKDRADRAARGDKPLFSDLQLTAMATGVVVTLAAYTVFSTRISTFQMFATLFWLISTIASAPTIYATFRMIPAKIIGHRRMRH